ncbi:hypothetical protein OC861_004611 [Tilletia horrida]|nr:hypothetical protein OC861_004611 [Tilletia horrida]
MALDPSSFLSSLRSLSFDEIQDLPSSISAKQAAVESNLSRLAVQHIVSVLNAREATSSLKPFTTSLRSKLAQIRTESAPALSQAVSDLPAQAQPAVFLHHQSDILAKTIADEEALTLLLHAPITVKNLVATATAGGALLGSSSSASASAALNPTGQDADTSLDAGTDTKEGGGAKGAALLEPSSAESRSQAANTALSITMRLFALASEGSALLSSTSPHGHSVCSPDTIEAASRSLYSIAAESLMYLHSLKMFLVQQTLHDVNLRLADAIRVVTMIRRMRNLRPADRIGFRIPASDRLEDSRLQRKEEGVKRQGMVENAVLNELGMSESHLMLAFFQARTSALRTILTSPPTSPPSSAMTSTSPQATPRAFQDLLDRAEAGATTACILAWKDQVSRTIAISKGIFDGASMDGSSDAEAREILPLLRSSYCSYSVRLLADQLVEQDVVDARPDALAEQDAEQGEVRTTKSVVRLRKADGPAVPKTAPASRISGHLMSGVGGNDGWSEATFFGLSQADLLRISTLHAHGLSRVAAVHAGVRHCDSGRPSSADQSSPSSSASSDGLAQVAALQGGQTFPALLLAATHNLNHASSSDHYVQSMGRLRNIHPALGGRRLGWTAGTEAGADTATGSDRQTKPSTSEGHSTHKGPRGDAQSKLLASAELAVPNYLALHNASCSRCGLPSLPGLTSTTFDQRPTKRRRRINSKSEAAASTLTPDTAKGVASGDSIKERSREQSLDSTLRCLLCGSSVVPGHGKASAELAKEETEAMKRSKARFSSVKKRSKAEREGMLAPVTKPIPTSATMKRPVESPQGRDQALQGGGQSRPKSVESLQGPRKGPGKRELIATAASPLDSKRKKGKSNPQSGNAAKPQARSSSFMQGGGGHSIYGSPSFLSSQLQKQKK